MGCIFSLCSPPSDPIPADAFLGNLDLVGLGYCSNTIDSASSSNASYFAMVSADWFDYYSPICGQSVRVSYKTTIQATVIDAATCTACDGDEDIILNYAAYSALAAGRDSGQRGRLQGVTWSFSGSPDDRPQPDPPSSSKSHTLTMPESPPPPHSSERTGSMHSDTATGSSETQRRTGLSSSPPPSTPATSSPDPTIQAASRNYHRRSTTIVLSVVLPVLALLFVAGLWFYCHRRLRLRRNRPVISHNISHPYREQSPQISPYLVQFGENGGQDASPGDKTAFWNDKAVDRGGFLQPVPILQPAPIRPSRRPSSIFDLERPEAAAERHFSLASLSRPGSVEIVGPPSSPS